MKKVLIFIENGFEEVEALTPVDLLRRAGAEVILATSVAGKHVSGRNKITVVCDKSYDEIKDQSFDMIIVPGGGPGVDALMKIPIVLEMIRKYNNEKKFVAAICAAPLVLKEAGILNGQNITSYPSEKLELESVSRYHEERVVVDGHLVTSRGPATAMDFALTLVGKLFDEKKVSEIKIQVVA